MAQQANGLSRTKWLCRYHIVFAPKCRRKAIYNQCRKSVGEVLGRPCAHKGVEMIGGHLMPDHVHMLVSIPPKISVSSFMGCLRGKSSLMMSEQHGNLKHEFGSRRLWAGAATCPPSARTRPRSRGASGSRRSTTRRSTG